MRYTIVYEKITDTTFPSGFYYAHVPSLDITTHGLGIDGAKEAAKDLIKLWLEEKKASHETIKTDEDVFISSVEV